MQWFFFLNKVSVTEFCTGHSRCVICGMCKIWGWSDEISNDQHSQNWIVRDRKLAKCIHASTDNTLGFQDTNGIPVLLGIAPGRPHVGPTNLAIRVVSHKDLHKILHSWERVYLICECNVTDPYIQLHLPGYQFCWRICKCLWWYDYIYVDPGGKKSHNVGRNMGSLCEKMPHTSLLTLIPQLHHDDMLMGPIWGPAGADRTQVGPMLAPWTLLSGSLHIIVSLWGESKRHWSIPLAKGQSMESFDVFFIVNMNK